MALSSVQRVRLGETPFAIIDLETTGLYAGRYDRAVEVAVVRTRPDGSIEDEFDTLVNPERDVGPTDIHGITASDVLHAPLFAQVAADVAARLEGAVMVGHNLRFDTSFLAAEYARMGIHFPAIPSLCTLRLAYRLLPRTIPSRKLNHCCSEAGIKAEDAHHALGDARATARLLAFYLRRAAADGCSCLEDLGCTPLELPPDGWGPCPPSGRRHRRADAAKRNSEERGYLPQLVARLRGDDATSADQAEYMALLDRVLADRLVTPEEAHSLLSLAQTWGLSRIDVLAAHDVYVASLVREALADGVVSPSERRDLGSVAEMLGISGGRFEELLSQRIESLPSAPPKVVGTSSLSGKSVCFTGTLKASIRGVPMAHEHAELMARAAGLTVLSSVTKKLDILVVADPNTQSSKAKKARQYGRTIMAEAAFWRAIGAQVE